MAKIDREQRYRDYLGFAGLIRGITISPNWMADGTSFWYVDGAPAETVVWKVDPLAATKEPLIDAVRLRKALRKELEHEPPYKGLPFSTITLLPGETAFQFAVEDREYVCDFETYTLERVVEPMQSVSAGPSAARGTSKAERDRYTPRKVRDPEMAGAPDVYEVLSPDRRWLAGVQDDQLYIRSTYDGRTRVLTQDGETDFAYDVFGASWSPDSLRIAVRKVDNRLVHKVPLVHWLKPVEEIEWRPFGKSGAEIPQNEVRIVDVLSGESTLVDVGDERDLRVYPMLFRPDAKELIVTVSNRVGSRMSIVAADPFTGATRELVTEETETFLHGIAQNTTFFPLWTREQFLWRAERPNWAHLYLYDMDGKLVRQLTDGDWEVRGVVGASDEHVFFQAHHDPARPYDQHLCRVPIEGGDVERLSDVYGTHTVALSPSGKAYLDVHSWLDRPFRVETRKADGTGAFVLADADVSRIEKLGFAPPDEFVVKAADGETDIYGVLYKPADFDPKKKYPVIDAIYGGPQTLRAPKTFAQDPFGQALAQLGFVVLIVDARGTPGRGKAFQDVVFKKFGQHEIPDHEAALKALAADRPWMDLSRVGIWGGSWGGYMTVRAMLTAPDTYHVGIATNGVFDHIDHMASAIEGYMRLPQDNPEGYAASDSLKLAGNLKGKLLLIHGTSDMNATFSATMKLVEQFTRLGKDYDLIVLPDQNHHPSGYGYSYYLDAHRRYFVEHLKP